MFHLPFCSFCYVLLLLRYCHLHVLHYVYHESQLSRIYCKIKTITHSFRISLSKSSFALPKLSCNPSSICRFKVLQILLRSDPLARKQNIFIWHDVISDSISKHQSNNHTSLSPEELNQLLFEFGNRISAFVYVQRSGSPDILKELSFHLGFSFWTLKMNVVSTETKDSFCYPFVDFCPPFAGLWFKSTLHSSQTSTKPCFTPEETAQSQARQALLPSSSIASVANYFLILVTLKVR